MRAESCASCAIHYSRRQDVFRRILAVFRGQNRDVCERMSASRPSAESRLPPLSIVSTQTSAMRLLLYRKFGHIQLSCLAPTQQLIVPTRSGQPWQSWQRRPKICGPQVYLSRPRCYSNASRRRAFSSYRLRRESVPIAYFFFYLLPTYGFFLFFPLMDFVETDSELYAIVKDNLRTLAPSPRLALEDFPPQVQIWNIQRPADSFVRLLFLLPGRPGDPLQFHVQVIPTTESAFEIELQYEAVSYFWGDPTPTNTVICNGLAKKIPWNAYNALLHLRKRDSVRCLWIDAVCIDQENISERNQQVLLMPKIYAQASRVIVWLGDHDPYDTVGHCFDLFRERAFPPQLRLRPPWRRSRMGMNFQLSKSGIGWSETDWRIIDMFLQRPWFRRAWVVQEIAMACRVEVMCGGHTLDWRHLATTIEDLHHSGLAAEHLSKDSQLSAQNVSEIEVLRKSIWVRKERSILDILLATNSTDCSDQRDKIFAMLSLTADSDQLEFPIDYRMSVSEVYAAFARWHIETHRGYHLLSCAPGKRDGSDEIDQMPSWVPDWTSIDNCHPLARYLNHYDVECITASNPSQRPYVEHDKLVLHAEIIGHIEGLGQMPTFTKTPLFRTLDEPSLKALYRNAAWLNDTITRLKKRGLDDSDIWRFITCELTGSVARAPASFERSFIQYHNFMSILPREEPLTKFEFDNLRDKLWINMRKFRDGVSDIESSLYMWASRRRLAETSENICAWVPQQSAHGDVIAYVHDVHVPLVFRPCGDSYFLVGEAYISDWTTKAIRAKVERIVVI